MVDRVNIKEMIPALPDEKIGNYFQIYIFINLILPLPLMWYVYMIYNIVFIFISILFIY